MDNKQVLEVVGKIAGIAGIATGAMFLIFREVIRKRIFPKLSPEDGYKIIRLIVILAWSIAVLGICAWVYSENSKPIKPEPVPIPSPVSDLLKIQSLDSANYSIYLELVKERIDTSKDTYQNLQLIILKNNPKRASYLSAVNTIRNNNEVISQYLLNSKNTLRTEFFKEKSEEFIQHAQMVGTRYESAILADTLSDLPKVTIPYPDNFSKALREEIQAWKE